MLNICSLTCLDGINWEELFGSIWPVNLISLSSLSHPWVQIRLPPVKPKGRRPKKKNGKKSDIVTLAFDPSPP